MGDRKIGQVLIEKGLIKEEQLENALKAQLIVGGHLGTCLIELGLIDETALGNALSENYGVPNVPHDALLDIDEATIAIVPAKVADEFRVIPFRVQQKKLHLAMVDPLNLPALDALSFAVGMRIVPWVAPELRIFQALERYYGIPRRVRYIALCQALDSAASKSGKEDLKGWAFAGSGAQSSAPPKPARAAVSMNPDRDIDNELSFDQELGFDYGKNWHEIAAEMELDDPSAPASAAPAEAAPSASRTTAPALEMSPAGPASLTETAERLCRADTKEDIAEAILGYTSAHMTRSILFGVSQHAATPWRAKGFPAERLPQIKMPVASGVFELLLGNELYRGAIPREAKYESCYRILGIERPSEVLLVPLYLGDRLVAVFHGDGGPRGLISGETDDFQRLFRLFGPTMNLLILKNKIRDGAHPPPEVRKKLQTV